MNGLSVVTPASAVLTAAQARIQCRIDHTDEDALLTAYVSAAMAEAEAITGRALWRTVYAFARDTFPAGAEPILLPRPTLVSVDQVEYRDAAGEVAELDVESLQVDGSREPGIVVPAAGASWPGTLSNAIAAVTVTFTAGPETPDPLAVQAVRLAVADWYEHREAVIEGAVSRLPNGFERLLLTRRFRSRELSRSLAES